jgi:hypothetical protein
LFFRQLLFFLHDMQTQPVAFDLFTLLVVFCLMLFGRVALEALAQSFRFGWLGKCPLPSGTAGFVALTLKETDFKATVLALPELANSSVIVHEASNFLLPAVVADNLHHQAGHSML